MEVIPFVGNIVYDLGMGVFQWADVVMCGLDNREARVAVNRRCLQVGRAWSDGAIERLDGTVRFFRPGEGACYECTMNETDWKMLEARRSCTLLSREQMMAGRTPTTATPSSIVAGFQCQQVLKHLHGLPVKAGAGLTLAGLCDEMRPVTYARRENCTAHEPLEQIIPIPARSDQISLADLLDRARNRLGAGVELELSREILHRFQCPGCGRQEDVFRSLGQVGEADAPCPECGETRFPVLLHSLSGDEPFLERTPRQLGLPPYDVVMGTTLEHTIGLLTEGDREEVLGEVPVAEPVTAEADYGDETG
jgi:adenylyltransferase/sulfurtransferase